METGLKLEKATELLYVSTGTRPDIPYSVNYLSRFQSCYDKSHFKYAMRVLFIMVEINNVK